MSGTWKSDKTEIKQDAMNDLRQAEEVRSYLGAINRWSRWDALYLPLYTPSLTALTEGEDR
ncbi:hypothetical protein [Deinococcus sp. Leaf326]|uniref:hypothetical protein n=1 Tax=Deinococcus sp. Leaf326 TaxID=1736338 RepID=UPI0006F4189F|nr:hypothetical protein [Deinococcus sp. Leaf326]KQR22882.1 hypothetical protein ASF71_06865 [Deinococcus sp. Leaf326]